MGFWEKKNNKKNFALFKMGIKSYLWKDTSLRILNCINRIINILCMEKHAQSSRCLSI